MIEEIIARLGAVLDLAAFGDRTSWLLYTNRGTTSSSILVFIFWVGSRDPRVIVKLSQDMDSIDREFNTLERLSWCLPRRVPRPHLRGNIRGMGFVAMEAVPGAGVTSATFERFVEDVLQGLIEVHSQVNEGPMTDDALRMEVLAPLSEFERAWTVGHQGLIALCHSVRVRLDGLRGAGLPRILQHSDFCLGNLIARPDGSIVFIDWEDFGAVALPAYDLVSLFVSLDKRVPFEDRSVTSLLIDALNTYMEKMTIDRRWLGVLVPLALMRIAMLSAAKGRPDPMRLTVSRLEALAAMNQAGVGPLGRLM
jgi:aminoglycoside phosphotransferase (APT) family kinase protein